MTQAVWKLFFGGHDEILIREVSLSRNNDSLWLPSRFNCCAEGLGTGVFTQPGPEGDIGAAADLRALIVDHTAGEAGEDRSEGSQPWPVPHVPIDRGCRAEGTVPENPEPDR